MRDIQIKRLRTRCRCAVSQMFLDVLFTGCNGVIILAGAYNLGHATIRTLETWRYCGRKFYRRFFSIHTVRLGISDKPVFVGVKPGIQIVFENDVNGLLCRFSRQQVYLVYREIAPHDDSAVESCDELQAWDRID